MMVPVSEFLPTLRMLVDVPVPGLMETAIVKAAQRFCRESKALVEHRCFDNVFSCQSVSVIANTFGHGKIQLKGAGVVAVTSESKTLTAGVDYSVKSLDQVKFNHHFSDVSIIGIAEPLANADHLPAILFTDYVDGICAGAASILQKQPNVAWFEPSLAQYNERDFTQAIRDAYRMAIESEPALCPSRPQPKREFY